MAIEGRSEMESVQMLCRSGSEWRSRLGLLSEPMGYVDGTNLYEFVADDPTGLVDPFGRKGQKPTTHPTSQPTTLPSLGWDDFQGTAPDNPDEDAFIKVELSTDYGKAKVQSAKDPCQGWKATAKYPNATVTAKVDKKGSWLVKGQGNDSLLQHEVGHLIIAQIGAQRATQKFRMLMGNGSGDTQAAAESGAIKDLQDQIQKAFDQALQQTQDQQDAYDNATDHGRNSDQQSEWQKKLQQWQASGSWD
jgi:hypothetical protein